MCFILFCVSPRGTAQPVVTIDPGSRFQTIEGLGGSLAFGEAAFGTMPSDKFNHLIWRLFDDLRLNLVRIRMRNEIEPVNDNANPDSINWSNVLPLPDTAALRVVRAGRALGFGLNVLATPWSPPSWLKTNDTTINGGHLKPGGESELAEWFRIFLLIWRDQYGVPVNVLSLQNEPSYVASYESCIYTPAELNRALRVVVPRLRMWGFDSLRIIGPDDASAETSLTFADSLLLPPEIRAMLSGFAIHNYSTPYTTPTAKVALLQTIRQRCAAANVPVWHTEYGNLNNTGAGTLAEAHLEAWHWLVALNELGSSTFLHWQIAATKRSNGAPLGVALVQYNTDNQTFYLPPKYYFVKHFTRFIWRGMVRVAVSGLPTNVRGSAFLDDPSERGVAVIQNANATAQTVRIVWPGADTLHLWRSSRTDTCLQLPPVVKTGNAFELSLPESSIVTLVGTLRGTNAVGAAAIPPEHFLEQNFPNPFNPTTTIRFSLDRPSPVSLKIFDVLGREIATLVHEFRSPGVYTVRWEGKDASSGMYVCRLQTEGFIASRRMLLLR
jgi:glucuronoarabinoxylan endo-1,4-beta-xylanase